MTLSWGFGGGALGGTRTPNLLIRSYRGQNGMLDLHKRRSQTSETGQIRWLDSDGQDIGAERSQVTTLSPFRYIDAASRDDLD